jgi:hypothetical protein
MKELVLRMGRPGVSVVLALAMAGCAWQTMESSSEFKTGVVEQPSSKGADVRTAAPTPAPKPKDKIAAAKNPDKSEPAAKQPPASPVAHQDEASCADVNKCVSVLKAMVADPNRTWIRRPAAPAVLANGVRLFAYRALRPKLTCSELAAALTETEMAAHAFSGSIAGLQPEQITHVRILSVEVGDELQAENARRCSPQSKDGPVGSAAPLVSPAAARQPGAPG